MKSKRRPKTEEEKKAISETLKGRKFSDQHRQNLRQATLDYYSNKAAQCHSGDTRAPLHRSIWKVDYEVTKVALEVTSDDVMKTAAADDTINGEETK
jgi:hypothetical protein